MSKDEISNSNEVLSPANDFETAITACGFGTFNICLLCVSISAVTSTVFATSTISYILPTAECDLDLSLMSKGILNAIPFAGMILSAIIWGYIADTKGRRKVLIYGLLVDGLFVLCSGFSQNVYHLLVLKFIDGFVVSGPFAVIMSYLSEFHGIQHRSRIMMITGMMKTFATLSLPLLAYVMLPHHLLMENKSFKIHTWQFFIMLTAVVPLSGGCMHWFLPESPKFLMSQGRNEEALECLQRIYAANSGNPKQAYPIVYLIDENPEKTQRNFAHRNLELQSSRSLTRRRNQVRDNFLEGLRQLKPLCNRPYLFLSMQVYSLLFCILLGLNSIRLWLPQLFATVVEYEHLHKGMSSMCAILTYSLNKTKLRKFERVVTESCDLHLTPDSYTNNIIVSLTSFCGFLVSTFCINKVGNNNVLRITIALSFISGTLLCFSTSAQMILALSSIFITACSVSSTAIISASVNLFPTKMRTMVVIMVMTFGRLGSLLGNILFPYFISMGCIAPFILIGGVMLLAFTMSLFLPNSTKVPLQ